MIEECAPTPDDWIQRMIDEGVGGTRIHWATHNERDRMTAGFVGGGGVWTLETLQSDGNSGLWVAEWVVWNQNAPEQRVWRTTYTAQQIVPTELGTPPELHAHAAELRQSLREILSFSESQHCAPFTEMFRKAIAALDGENVHGYHRDLSPPGILIELEQRVVDACQLASVFGGMGSWNDMGFAGATQETYRAVSNRLFAALSTSMPTAINGWVHRREAAA